MKYHATTLYIALLALGAMVGFGGCLQEQNNPLKNNTVPNCFDNILNQDETGVDCGGICSACPQPVVAPCRDSLADNQIMSALLNTMIFNSVRCQENITQARYQVVGNGRMGDVRLTFGTDSLPQVDKVYDIAQFVDLGEMEKVTLRIVLRGSISGFNATSGQVFVTFLAGIATLEFCDLRTASSIIGPDTVSGRLACP